MSLFWSHCLNHFERELSSQQFATWFRVLSAEETDSTVTVVAPNAFISKWVRDRYLGTIDSLASQYFPEPRTIRLTIAGNGATNTNSVIASPPAATPESGERSVDSIPLSAPPVVAAAPR